MKSEHAAQPRKSTKLNIKGRDYYKTFEYKMEDKFYNETFLEDHDVLPNPKPMIKTFNRNESSDFQTFASEAVRKRDKKADEKQHKPFD